jgi:hypothetical protein
MLSYYFTERQRHATVITPQNNTISRKLNKAFSTHWTRNIRLFQNFVLQPQSSLFHQTNRSYQPIQTEAKAVKGEPHRHTSLNKNIK